jgi:flagellar basal body-associated protein FliL
MTNEEPKITFDSILQNWNAHYNPTAKAQTQQPIKALELSATMRNPNTPAGTYPVFETYLGVDVLEKKRQLKQEKRRKRKEIRGKIFGFLKVVIPILLVGGAIIGGFMFFKPSTPQNTSNGDIQNVPQAAETIAIASPTTTSVEPTPTVAPEGVATPTAGATPEQKHCLTTPTKSPFLDGNGALHYGKGTGHDSYYVPANEDCGVRYTAEDGSSYHEEDDNSVGKGIAKAIILIVSVAIGMVLLVMFIAILAI